MTTTETRRQNRRMAHVNNRDKTVQRNKARKEKFETRLVK